MSNYSNLVSEFSNPIRIKLLFMLSDNPATLSELTKKISDISHSEVSRHLGRLAEQEMIQKESISSRKYKLTDFGQTLVRIFSPMEFIFQQVGYFRNHRLEDLPVSLLREIDALSEAKFIFGTGNVMCEIHELVKSANELWIMSNTRFPVDFTGKVINLLFPLALLHDSNVDRNDLPPDLKARILPRITISVAFSDLDRGILSFPSTSSPENPDYSSGCLVSDLEGLKYLRKIWSFFWKQGKKVPK